MERKRTEIEPYTDEEIKELDILIAENPGICFKDLETMRAIHDNPEAEKGGSSGEKPDDAKEEVCDPRLRDALSAKGFQVVDSITTIGIENPEKVVAAITKAIARWNGLATVSFEEKEDEDVIVAVIPPTKDDINSEENEKEKSGEEDPSSNEMDAESPQSRDEPMEEGEESGSDGDDEGHGSEEESSDEDHDENESSDGSEENDGDSGGPDDNDGGSGKGKGEGGDSDEGSADGSDGKGDGSEKEDEEGRDEGSLDGDEMRDSEYDAENDEDGNPPITYGSGMEYEAYMRRTGGWIRDGHSTFTEELEPQELLQLEVHEKLLLDPSFIDKRDNLSPEESEEVERAKEEEIETLAKFKIEENGPYGNLRSMPYGNLRSMPYTFLRRLRQLVLENARIKLLYAESENEEHQKMLREVFWKNRPVPECFLKMPDPAWMEKLLLSEKPTWMDKLPPSQKPVDEERLHLLKDVELKRLAELGIRNDMSDINLHEMPLSCLRMLANLLNENEPGKILFREEICSMSDQEMEAAKTKEINLLASVGIEPPGYSGISLRMLSLYEIRMRRKEAEMYRDNVKATLAYAKERRLQLLMNGHPDA